MNTFNTPHHSLALSEDGTYTAYSKEYAQHYHSTKDGALHESLVKHVIPAFKYSKNKNEIKILDICFGLGFNVLATLHYATLKNIHQKIYIYSPELDSELVSSLNNFTYPKEFTIFEHIIKALLEEGIYDDATFHIELFLGDAREYIQKFSENTFDIVYQDAFSPDANPSLWTKEYFKDIQKIMKEDGILTTYSIALATRIALYENEFLVYLNEGKDFRASTLASLSNIEELSEVNVEHKMKCNPQRTSLRD
ncbi:hypothetical protein JHD48_00265 [Sulfurimonas sp. SAG-AH-194-I05]|nr:MnmC family methyltransferase [Sulfurimonas sp. SAG-AH-194-I05]MDF1874159.1 hypothetical protein [Sulfurimonas sp. SAG-AH-194-I05]